jgi:dihydroorotase (multifunctional complex type)
MRRIAVTGKVAVIHAENDAICSCLASELQASGQRTAMAHARSRPPVAEAEAVARAIRLAGEAGARVSIAHVSTAAALKVIRTAKAEGQAVTAEACPHHLLLTEDELDRVGPYGKINPPLRSASDRDALWDALLDGTIDFVGTDHAPYTASEKDVGWTDIWQAPSGAHGLETVLPLLLSEVNRGRITLPQLTRVVSLGAARTFGLAGRKGELRVGMDADLCLIDLAQRRRVDRAALQSVSRDAARLWDGRELIGTVGATYVRGRPVYCNGQIVGAEGYGELVRAAS